MFGPTLSLIGIQLTTGMDKKTTPVALSFITKAKKPLWPMTLAQRKTGTADIFRGFMVSIYVGGKRKMVMPWLTLLSELWV